MTRYDLQTPPELYRKDALLWNPAGLLCFDQDLIRCPSFQLDQIDTIMSNGTEHDRSRVGQVLYKFLSEMTAVNEAMSAINLQPFRKSLVGGTLMVSRICRLVESINNLELLSKAFAVNELAYPGARAAVDWFRLQALPSRTLSRESVLQTQKLQISSEVLWEHMARGLKLVLQGPAQAPAQVVARFLAPIEAPLHGGMAIKIEQDLTSLLVALEAKGINLRQLSSQTVY